jgi:hypothetical protein
MKFTPSGGVLRRPGKGVGLSCRISFDDGQNQRAAVGRLYGHLHLVGPSFFTARGMVRGLPNLAARQLCQRGMHSARLLHL